MTIGAETHVGLGALVGRLIVGVTLAGCDATPDNVAKLVALTHKEEAAARAAVGASGDQWRGEPATTFWFMFGIY